MDHEPHLFGKNSKYETRNELLLLVVLACRRRGVSLVRLRKTEYPGSSQTKLPVLDMHRAASAHVATC